MVPTLCEQAISHRFNSSPAEAREEWTRRRFCRNLGSALPSSLQGRATVRTALRWQLAALLLSQRLVCETQLESAFAVGRRFDSCKNNPGERNGRRKRCED